VSVSIGVVASKSEVVEQLTRLLEATGHRVSARAIVRTRKPELTTQLKTWIADPAIQVVIGIDSVTMRAALLPLITKRLVAFNDLRDVDGGQCESTLVILLPKEVTLESLTPVLERVERELEGRGRRRTVPPPAPRPSTSTSTSSISVSRSRPKTAPPPVPVREEPDFIIRHRRPSEAEFADQLASIRPIRLEPMPVVVSPKPQVPVSYRYQKWLALGGAIACGALVGIVMRVASSSNEQRDSVEVTARAVEVHAPEDVDLADFVIDEHGPFIVMDEDVLTSIEMPALRMRKHAAIPLWKVFADKPEREVPLWKVFTDKPERYASRTRPRGTLTPRAPAKRPEPIQMMTAAQLWNNMGTVRTCDVMTCSLAENRYPCCARFRMDPGRTSEVRVSAPGSSVSRR
jgi:hypothetical protein